MLTKEPDPLPVMKDAAKYHRALAAHHAKIAIKLDAAIAVLEGNDESTVETKPTGDSSVKILKVPLYPLSSEYAVSKTKGALIEDLIRDSGVEGITALGIRAKAREMGQKMAPNFPYRELAKLSTKVWKDAAGVYRHTSVVPASLMNSAQEVTH
jgi:hypothetical protein